LISAGGSGSCFRVLLPLVRNVCLLPDVPPGAGPGDARALAGRRVLVVENDPGMRQAFTMLLSGWGMDVSDAATVEAARRAARSTDRRPDLVLTDYRLDGEETGVQAIEALRRDLRQKVPAVIVSAEGAAAIRLLSAPLGVPVLEKPVPERRLRRVLRELLEAPG
jgi:CheY-like chemotaxis protein